jgi:hypothetical protein
VEILASVGGFSVNFSGQCHPFPDDQIIQKMIPHCLILSLY